MTATADRPVRSGTQAQTPSSSRVRFLVGQDHLIDMLLPAAVPLSRLAGPAVKTVNRILVGRSEPELPAGSYVFARAAGMTLMPGNLSLAQQGITDGDLLALIPAPSAQRYEPNIENVSAALARYAKGHFPAVSLSDARRAAVALTLVALTLAGVLLWRLRWASDFNWLVPALFGGAAVALAGASVLAGRLGAERFITAALTWSGVAALVATAATAPPAVHPGAPHAFLAAVVAMASSLGIARFTGRNWVPAVTVVTVCAAIIGASLTRMFFAVPGQRIAVVVLVAALLVSIAAPPIGRMLAKVPQQSFESITGKDIFERNPGDDEDTVSPVEDSADDVTLRGPALEEVANRSNRVLTGVTLGTALVELAATWCAIHPGVGTQWTFVTLAATVALTIISRARAFRDRRHAMITVGGATLSLFAIPAHYGLTGPAGSTSAALAACAALAGIAMLALVAGAVVPARSFSAPVREIAEYLEYVAITVIIVFAGWTIDLLHFARYH